MGYDMVLSTVGAFARCRGARWGGLGGRLGSGWGGCLGPGSSPVPELHMSDVQVEVARARGAAGAAAGAAAGGFGSGKETAAQLAAQFGSGKETAAQLDSLAAGRSRGGANGSTRGGSKPGSGPTNGPGKRKDWPPGTVMAWCPNCGAAGGKGKRHDKFIAEGGGHCGRYSLSAPPELRLTPARAGGAAANGASVAAGGRMGPRRGCE
jgi:hypothetical protein